MIYVLCPYVLFCFVLFCFVCLVLLNCTIKCPYCSLQDPLENEMIHLKGLFLIKNFQQQQSHQHIRPLSSAPLEHHSRRELLFLQEQPLTGGLSGILERKSLLSSILKTSRSFAEDTLAGMRFHSMGPSTAKDVSCIV